MYLCGIIFMFLGFAFGITGQMTNMRLKSHFTEFYNENKCMLLAATYGLSIPMILRGLNDIMTRASKTYHQSIIDHNISFEIGFFLVLDVPLITFQLSSLVFGYIRRKQNENKKYTSNNEYDDIKMEISNGDEMETSTNGGSDMSNSFFDPPLEIYIQISN